MDWFISRSVVCITRSLWCAHASHCWQTQHQHHCYTAWCSNCTSTKNLINILTPYCNELCWNSLLNSSKFFVKFHIITIDIHAFIIRTNYSRHLIVIPTITPCIVLIYLSSYRKSGLHLRVNKYAIDCIMVCKPHVHVLSEMCMMQCCQLESGILN